MNRGSAWHLRQSGDPRHASGSERLPGRRRLLPGLLQLRVLPGRAHLPQPGPGALGADRQRAGPAEPAAPADGTRLVRRRLRADAAPPRRPVLADRHERRAGRRHHGVHRHRPGRPVVRADPVPGVGGIDPDLAWDDDGTCWCTYAGIEQVRIDPATGQTFGPPRRLWSGTPGAQAPEAPHLYRIGDYWYLLIAEGGTERGPRRLDRARPHARRAVRALPGQPDPHPPRHQPADPEHRPRRPRRRRPTARGGWCCWACGRGGGTPGWHVLGRETFLAPVTWVDGWPVVGELAPVMARHRGRRSRWPPPPVRDDFDGDRLHPRWISVRSRPAEHWSLTERPGLAHPARPRRARSTTPTSCSSAAASSTCRAGCGR